jgi:hypothetical protein
MEQLREEWRKDTSAASSLGNGSPLDFLLEPTDGAHDMLLLLGDDDSEGKSITITSRSASSDSMISTPSLEADLGTYLSRSSTPSTPISSLRRSPRVVERRVCSPPAEEVHDHPLLSVVVSDDDDSLTSTTPKVDPQLASQSKPRSSFKSNLTASFQALKSAAKAFSNFTAPSLPSDDMLTRSLFSSNRPYAPEMMPRNFGAVADPALRRYMNPTPPLLSSPDFAALITDALAARDDPSEGEGEGLMIQMTTYGRSGGPGKKGGHRGTDRSEFVAPTQRQREPRENGDFLRVIVLEMNMRRKGKLDAKSAGRARVWLPPRKVGEVSTTSQINNSGSRTVPLRWVGVSSDHLE